MLLLQRLINFTAKRAFMVLDCFWNSNLFQTIVLIVTAFITLGLYWDRKRKEVRNAAVILSLQIDEIEKNIEYVLSEGIINGAILETSMHYSSLIFEENHWDKYSHLIVGHISSEAFEKIDEFYKAAYQIREQQVFIKQKIQQSIDSKVWHYYAASYTQVANNDVDLQIKIQAIHDRFNIISVPPFIHKEFAIGLEKALKRYSKLTDGNAYAEIKKLAK